MVKIPLKNGKYTVEKMVKIITKHSQANEVTDHWQGADLGKTVD